MIGQYPFKSASITVSLSGRVPTFEFSSGDGDVRFMQLSLWREDWEQPVWSIVADNPPQEYTPRADHPYPETEGQLLGAMFHDGLRRMASGEGSIRVRSLRYSDVPPGFRQQRPIREAPAELTVGSYFLSVAGEYTGTAAFKIEEP